MKLVIRQGMVGILAIMLLVGVVSPLLNAKVAAAPTYCPPASGTPILAGRNVQCTFYYDFNAFLTDPLWSFSNAKLNWPNGYYDAFTTPTPAQDNAASFIFWMATGLSSCGVPFNVANCAGTTAVEKDQSFANAVGDSYIINTQRGRVADNYADSSVNPPNEICDVVCGIWEAQNPVNFNAWATTIQEYDAAGKIDWNVTLTHASLANIAGPECGGAGGRSDTVIYQYTTGFGKLPDETAYNNTDCGTEDYIVFRDPISNLPIYRINRKCGNVTGSIANPLPPVPNTPFTLTPTVISPPTVGATISGSAQVKSNIGYPINNVPNITRRFYVLHANTTTTPITTLTSTSSVPASSSAQAFNDTGIALPALVSGDSVCETISSPQSGVVDPFGNIVGAFVGTVTSAPLCSAVTTPAYFSVFGGDVFAGANDGTASNCTGWGADNTNAGIYAFRGASPQQGAGAQAGVFALGNVDNAGSHGFSSVILSALAPLGLTFANTGVGSPGGLGVVHCPYDYYGNMNVGAGVSLAPGNAIELNGQLNSNAGNNYSVIHSPVPTPVRVYASGNTVNSSAGGSTVINLYVNGNILISSNIAYGNAGGWGSTAEIPRVQVVAKGNIYITNAVTQLDGIYVAQGGTIYTCATNPPGISPLPAIPANALYGSCNNQLVVNGALVASRIKWLRTYGSVQESQVGENPNTGANRNCQSAGALVLSTVPTCASEVINFSPEAYLVAPPPSPQGVNATYDSITSLPPLL